MKFDSSDTVDTGGGNFLDEPGTYHLVVMSLEENPSVGGKVLDGVQAKFVAVEGTTRANGEFTERDKTVSLTFWHPKLTDKNEGAFARKKQTALFIACGLMTHEDLGRQGLDINLESATGRQVIATLERDKENPKYLRLHFSDIWHIDDPNAAKCPKCEKTLALIPPQLRRDPASFPSKGSAPTQKRNGPDVDVNLDDL